MNVLVAAACFLAAFVLSAALGWLLYDRMLAAGVRPEFPEPLTPEKFTALGWILIFAGPMILILIHTSHHS